MKSIMSTNSNVCIIAKGVYIIITCTNYGCHYCISSRIIIIITYIIHDYYHHSYYYHYVISSQFFFICRVTQKPKYGWAIILRVT